MGRLRSAQARLAVKTSGGELHDRYFAFHSARGNDLQRGLRLAELLRTAGLDVIEHRGRLHTVTRTPGQRGPAWAARESMVAAGFATPEDLPPLG